MPNYAGFSVTTPSRHPGNAGGYDSVQHRYRPEYVNPASWVLQLHFTPAGMINEGRLPLPEEISSWEWTIRGENFQKNIQQQPANWIPEKPVTAELPKPGDYEITLQVNLHAGGTDVNTQSFGLRDYLIVGIGDSFASGEGNPDVPAVAAPDQEVMCKATSIVLVATKIIEAVEELGRELEADEAKVIAEIPYIGTVIVGYLNGVHSLVDYVTSRIGQLGDWAIGVGRDVEATVVEGAKEFLGLFGIGDGGDKDEAHPHPAAWQEPAAHRSYRSGQSLAAAQQETQSAFGADRVTFLGFGRSGSEIDNGILGPRTSGLLLGGGSQPIDGWTGNRGQIQEARDTAAGRPVDAVVVSVGINDLGFSSLVQNSILKASGQARKDRIAGANRKVDQDLPARLNQLRAAIDEQLQPRRVFITEYPVGVFQEIALGAPPCGVLSSSIPNLIGHPGFNLDGPDARDMHAVGIRLNTMIQRKADEFGWIYVGGIAKACDGHGYCSRQPYFVSAEESCLNQGDFEGMIHPNALGHAATRDALAQALHDHLLTDSDWLEPVLAVLMT
jgi:lysophospholipase L1-like esterase